MNEVLFSSNSDEWETPQKVFDDLNEEFHFNLDPCSTDENCKCFFHFTKEQNGLNQPWGGGEYSAIHHTPRSRNGLRKRFTKGIRTERLLCF